MILWLIKYNFTYANDSYDLFLLRNKSSLQTFDRSAATYPYKNVAVVSTNLVISLPCKWRRIVDAYPPNCTAPPSLDLSSFRVCKHELGHCKCTRRSDVCVKVVTFGVSLTSPRLGRVVGRVLHTLALEAGRTQRSFSKLHLHPLSSLQPLVCLFTLFAWYKVFFFLYYLWTDANFVVFSSVRNVHITVCRNACVSTNSARQQRAPLINFVSTLSFLQ